MSTFGTYILHQEYAAIAARGDPLNAIHDLIDWELFRPRLSTLYASDRDQGGRPHTDVIVLMKLLVLQQQLDARGLTIRRGVIQDATFITADPGHAKADTPRGDQARTRRSRDGTWAKKGKKSQFGFKLHTLVDKEFQLIRRMETTTASLHDSRIDLSQPGETVYRDKGYFGVKPAASMDKTMHRAVRNHPLSIKEKRRNRAISRTRALVERPYAVIKRYFHAGHVMVTTVARVHLATMFACFCYNLLQLRTIHHTVSSER